MMKTLLEHLFVVYQKKKGNLNLKKIDHVAEEILDEKASKMEIHIILEGKGHYSFPT